MSKCDTEALVPTNRPRKQPTMLASFGEFLESNHLALPCTYSRCHQGQRHIFKTRFRNGGPRRFDYIAVPKTWLAATAKSLVLEHFDVYTIIYEDKPVAVEIKGPIMSHEAFSKIRRFDK